MDHEFLFVLAPQEVSLQEKSKIKKAYRKHGKEVNCIYHSAQLFQMPWDYDKSRQLTICLEFQRAYFIPMIQWIEKIRRLGFKGTILLSFYLDTFDYEVIPKFLACGGSFLIDQSAWRTDPLLLIENFHDESVFEWLSNKAYEHNAYIDNDDAIRELYNQVIREKSYSVETLSYIYKGLSSKNKDEFIAFIRDKLDVIKLDLPFRDVSKKLSRGIISVWDNPEFCCELGIQLAKTTDKSVLMVDLDRLNPAFDFYCGIGNAKKRKPYATLNEIQRLYAMGNLTDESIKELPTLSLGVKNLSIIYGCYELKKFEYFTNEALIEALASFRRGYDIVLVNVNKFVYDAYTCLGLIKSDYVLVPIDGYITTIREYQRSIELLCEKQRLPAEKFSYVYFECEEVFSGEMTMLSELLRRPIMGAISKCKKRRYCRNLKKVYGLSMTKKSIREYKQLIKNIIA